MTKTPMKKTTLQIASENNKRLLDNLIPSKSIPIYAQSFDGADNEIYNKSFKQIQEDANNEKRHGRK